MSNNTDQIEEFETELKNYFRVLHELAKIFFHSNPNLTAMVLRAAKSEDLAAEIIRGGTCYYEHAFDVGSPEDQRKLIREQETCIKAFGKDVPQPASPEVASFLAS
jgi:hypothetical protein